MAAKLQKKSMGGGRKFKKVINIFKEDRSQETGDRMAGALMETILSILSNKTRHNPV